jgi:hypothetical protein
MPADVAGQGWRIMQPVPNYDSGSDGPKATDELLTDDDGASERWLSERKQSDDRESFSFRQGRNHRYLENTDGAGSANKISGGMER